MAKLYPPYIEGKLPAFVGTTIVVPFSMNRAVSMADVRSSGGLHLIVKRINKDEILVDKDAVGQSLYDNCYATFFLTQEEKAQFTLGQYYRVQLAYKDKAGIIGYYSSVGVIKYTTYPYVGITGLDEVESNNHTYDYTGVYRQDKDTGDSTEKMYSSTMILKDSQGNILYDSGEVVHNTARDVLPNEASENFRIPCGLNSNEIYRLQFSVKTINNLTVFSPIYRVAIGADGGVHYSVAEQLKLTAVSNYDRGTVDLTIYNLDLNIRQIRGMFLFSRTEAQEPHDWQPIRFVIYDNTPFDTIKISDFTVEQGKHYLYAIQQYNNFGVYSARTLSKEIAVDFEDYYLLDPERQLKIRFNPRISSMKNTVIANRVNTIGSKYPHVVRSGVVGYKEFSLSGLISYHMDDNEDFINWDKLGLTRVNSPRASVRGEIDETLPSYDLTWANVAAERIFKLETLEWLNNGKPKILKSPAEGNYIVELMDVTLSPEDKLSRMLHTFNGQAMEIADFNYANLLDYGFFDAPPDSVPQWKTIEFATADPITGVVTYKTGELLPPGTTIKAIHIEGIVPGTKVEINGQIFQMPRTGRYEAEVDEDIISVKLPDNYRGGGSMTYYARGHLVTGFDAIHGYSNYFHCGHQFIGTSTPANSNSIISNLVNVRDSMVKFIGMRIYKRDILDVYVHYNECDGGIPKTSNNFYYDSAGEQQININNFLTETGGTNTTYTWNNIATLFRINYLPFDIINGSRRTYQIRTVEYTRPLGDGINITRTEEVYYYNNSLQFPKYSGYFYDPNRGGIEKDDFDTYNCEVRYYDDFKRPHDTVVNLEAEGARIYVWDYEFAPARIRPHAGVIVDLTYIGQSIKYAYEDETPAVINAYNYYQQLLEAWKTVTQSTNGLSYIRQNSDGTTTTVTIRGNCTTEEQRYTRNNQIQTLRKRVKSAYNAFIDVLSNAIATDEYYRWL